MPHARRPIARFASLFRRSAFSLGNASERHAVEAFADLIEDELNVKHVRLLDTSTEAVSHSIKPLPKQLGQKYGNKFPALQKALVAMDAEQVAQAFLSVGSVKVTAGGEPYDILPGRGRGPGAGERGLCRC